MSLIFALGNNKDKINDILDKYFLPALTDKTFTQYFSRAKIYNNMSREVLKELVSYYRNENYNPPQELLGALRVASSMQLRCIVNSEIILGNKLEGAPELLSFKELETYKFFFFDITAWSYPDWKDYKKEVDPYERTALKYALGGKVRDLLIALQIIPDSTEDAMFRDAIAKSYKQLMQIENEIENTKSPEERERLTRTAKLRLEMMGIGQRSRMAGKTSVEVSRGGEKKDSMPKFRLILVNPDGTIAVRKTREELEADMKKRLEEDEKKFKELSEKSAGGITSTAEDQAKS